MSRFKSTVNAQQLHSVCYVLHLNSLTGFDSHMFECRGYPVENYLFDLEFYNSKHLELFMSDVSLLLKERNRDCTCLSASPSN